MTTPQPKDVTTKTSRTTSRAMTVVLMLAGGVLALIGATQTWVSAAGFDATHIGNVQLSGQEASPVITAMALVTIAAGAALSIAQRIGRWIIGIVVIFATVMLGYTTLSIVLDPAAAVAQKIAETTGTTGLNDAATTLDVSVLPWLTLVGALLGCAAGVMALVRGGRWPVGKTKKYEVGPEQSGDRDGPLDEIDTWDELSRGKIQPKIS